MTFFLFACVFSNAWLCVRFLQQQDGAAVGPPFPRRCPPGGWGITAEAAFTEHSRHSTVPRDERPCSISASSVRTYAL